LSEQQIRSFLEAMRQRLGRTVLTTALGAGLALCPGCGHREAKPDAKTADGSVDTQQTVDARPPRPEFLPLPYMAPDAAPLHQHLNRQA